MKKIKISELPESRNLRGLHTIGTDENNRSVKVPLDFLDGVAEAANQANETASQAKTQADNAVSLLNSAIVQSEGNNTQKVMSQSAVTQSLQEVRLAANSISDDVDALQAEVGRKADRSNTYTKTEADAAIDSRINGIINGAPEALDTLKEIADAIGEDGSAINTLRGSVVENARKILSLERTNTSQQRAIDTLSGNVEDLTDGKLDKDAVVQEMGESEESVMSQKAVTDALLARTTFKDIPFEMNIAIDNRSWDVGTIIHEDEINFINDADQAAAMADVKAGDIVVLNVYGRNYRAYALLDSDGRVVQASPVAVTVDKTIKIEQDGKIFVNASIESGSSSSLTFVKSFSTRDYNAEMEHQLDWEMIDRAKIWSQMLNMQGALVKIKAGETVTFLGNATAKASDSHDTWVWVNSPRPHVGSLTEGIKIADVGYIKSDDFTILRQQFQFLANVKKLEVASDICSSRITSALQAFKYCKSLEQVDLSHWDVSNITTLSELFSYCQSLISVGNLSGWNLSNCQDISKAFYNCSHLKELNVSNWDTSNVETINRVFYGCSALDLQQAGVETWMITNNCSNFESAFYRSIPTKHLSLPSWDTSSVSSFNATFRQMTQLQTLNISSWSTESATSLQNMFTNDNSLRYITVGEKFFMTQLALPFNGAANLGLNPDGTSNGWLEHVAAVAPRIREKAGYGTDPDIPLLEEENGEWYLNDNHTRTIQLPTLLYNKDWAQALKAELMFKGYSITNT